MRRPSLRAFFGGLICFLAFLPASGQQAHGDAQALAVAVQCVAAMGGHVPSTTMALGTIDLVEGSREQSGSIRILTRGSNESVEEIQTDDGLRASVYSKGRLARKTDSSLQRLNLEMAATGQSPVFPLALLGGALGNPDFLFEYVGLETMEGINVHHIRFQDTYASKPKLKELAEMSVRDVWLDATTGLPRRIFYYQSWSRGKRAEHIPVDTFLSDYRDVGGVLYPFAIKRSLNGTPWATIQIHSVVLSPSLSDADFQTR